MSDKNRKAVKLSVRVPKESIIFIQNRGGQFKNRSDFVNQALDFFIEHLNILKSFEGRLERNHISSMSESRTHLKLKHLGWSVLDGMGCNPIDYEFPMILEGKRVKLDVHGIMSNGEHIAIECWASSKNDREKFELLKKHFNRLIVLTNDDLIEYYEDLLYWYEKNLNRLSTRFNVPIARSFEKPANFITETPRGHKLYRVSDEKFIPLCRRIPYKAMLPILRANEVAFLEDFKKQQGQFNRSTISNAAKKLSLMVGKKVVAERGLMKLNDGVSLEGYLFTTEKNRKEK